MEAKNNFCGHGNDCANCRIGLGGDTRFRVTNSHVQKIIRNSKIAVTTVFNKCTIVSCELPNGFVISEYTACIDPRSYDKEIGKQICLDKIARKIKELEGYMLQTIWEFRDDGSNEVSDEEGNDDVYDEVNYDHEDEYYRLELLGEYVDDFSNIYSGHLKLS